MVFHFRPASQVKETAGLFVSLTGGTNSGKSWSALALARGIAGPGARIAAMDTEGGRLVNLKAHFDFDINIMGAPFRPQVFAEGAQAAEEAGYGALVIDSFSMEWAGLGGVLNWQEEELDRMAGDDFRKREACKMAAWIKPKTAHKAMVMSLLQRRIPIIFAIRGEETVKPVPGKPPEKIFKSICSATFPFEVTVAFRLASDRKGYVDLSDPKSYKMEGDHHDIFKDGDRISEEHGAALARWAKQGVEHPKEAEPAGPSPLIEEGDMAAERGSATLSAFWGRLSKPDKHAVGGANQLAAWKLTAAQADEAAERIEP